MALGAILLLLAVVSAEPTTTQNSGTTLTTTTTVLSLAAVGQIYTKDADAFGQVLDQWNAAVQTPKQDAIDNLSVPDQQQVEALLDPLIAAGNRLVVQLQQLSVPTAVRSDLKTEVGALSAFIGDEKEVIALWPAAQSVTQQGEADVSRLNAAAAAVALDLHVTLTSVPEGPSGS